MATLINDRDTRLSSEELNRLENMIREAKGRVSHRNGNGRFSKRNRKTFIAIKSAYGFISEVVVRQPSEEQRHERHRNQRCHRHLQSPRGGQGTGSWSSLAALVRHSQGRSARCAYRAPAGRAGAGRRRPRHDRARARRHRRRAGGARQPGEARVARRAPSCPRRSSCSRRPT